LLLVVKFEVILIFVLGQEVVFIYCYRLYILLGLSHKLY